MARLITAFLLVALLPVGTRARAEESPAEKSPAEESCGEKRSGKQSSAEKSAETQSSGDIRVSGSWRLRMECWDWFEPTGDFNNDYLFGASLLRVAIEQQLPCLDWRIQFAQATLIGVPDDAIAPAPQGALGSGGSFFAVNGEQDGTLFLKEAFVRFKNLGDERSQVRLGRFEFNDGLETRPKDTTLLWLKQQRIAERLMTTHSFSPVNQSLDAVQWIWDSPEANVTLLAGRRNEGVARLAGWDKIDVTDLYGALTCPWSTGEVRLFALHTSDDRDAVKVDNRPLAARQADTEAIRVTTLGGHGLQVCEIGPGKLDGLVWAAVQFGEWGRLSHLAAALALETGYQWHEAPWKPWLRFGWFRGSGDGDPNDDRHGTYFSHSAARLYSRALFYNQMNNDDLFAALIVQPTERLSLRMEAHRLLLSDARDLWYAGPGAFTDDVFGYAGRPSGGGDRLMHLFDLGANYRLSPDCAFTIYGAHAVGGSVVRSNYPGREATFLYTEVRLSF